jgi:hypothetical protein
MSKHFHRNQFDQVPDKKDVYNLLQGDLMLYIRRGQFFGLLGVGVLIYSYILGIEKGWGWMLLSLPVFYYGLCQFIDASNLNFTMHMIDWLERDNQPEKSHD